MHALHREVMQHNAARHCQIMDDFESVELIGDMLGSTEIGHQMEFSAGGSGNGVVVQVEAEAIWVAIDINCHIREAQPHPEVPGGRGLRSEMLEFAVRYVRRH